MPQATKASFALGSGAGHTGWAKDSSGNQIAYSGGKTAVTISDGSAVEAHYDITLGNETKFTLAKLGGTGTASVVITAPTPIGNIVLVRFANNDIGVLYKSLDQTTIRYAKFTYSTLAISGAWETVLTTAAGGVFDSWDADISDNGAVSAVMNVYNSNATSTFYVRTRGTGGSWVTTISRQATGNGTFNRGYDAAGCTVISTGPGGPAVVTAFANAQGDHVLQVNVYRFNESTGAMVGVAFSRNYSGFSFTSAPANQPGNRLVRVFRSAASEFTVVGVQSNSTALIARGKMDVAVAPDTSWVYTWTLGPQAFSAPAYIFSTGLYTAITNGNNGTYAIHTITGGADIVQTIRVYTENGVVKYTKTPGYFFFFQYSSQQNYDGSYTYPTRMRVSGNGQNKPGDPIADHEIGLHLEGYSDFPGVGGYGSFILAWADIPAAAGSTQIINLVPGNNSLISTSNPSLGALVDFLPTFAQGGYKAEWQFATDTGFTANVVDYIQPDSKFVAVVDPNVPGTPQITDVLPQQYALTGYQWYLRARLRDEYGNIGAWTPTYSVRIGHAPSAQQLYPLGGRLYPDNGGLINFQWGFSDPSPTDYQTAFSITVNRLDTGAQLYASGKKTGSAKSYQPSIGVVPTDVAATWTLQVWDSNDDPSMKVTSGSFMLTVPPAVILSAPISGATLSTGVPTFTFTPTTGGSPQRTIQEYIVSVTQGAQTVWAQRSQLGDLASGSVQSIKMPQGVLQNNQDYTVQVLITDSGGMQAVSAPVSFRVAWVPPATPTGVTVDSSQYNTSGFVRISWDDTARDVDFTGWRIERKSDLINSDTGAVIEEGSWEVIWYDYDTGAAYIYDDYVAPANYKVNYRVIQSVNRLGQDIDSDSSSSVSTTPFSDGYWLIQPYVDGSSADVFKLSIVTGDSFTDEQEEAEFTVIGRGRIVNKGQRLGVKGTLDVQLRDTGNTTARQKRLRLLDIQQVARTTWLRNPFGDIIKVNISQMQVGRIAGVGRSEYCDVSIPYSEVG